MKLYTRNPLFYMLLMCLFVLSAGLTQGEEIAITLDGKPLEADFGYGWSHEEYSPEVGGMRWIEGLEADLDVKLPEEAKVVAVEISAAPLPQDRRVQSLGLFVNRRLAAEWVCEEGAAFASYRAAVDPRLFQGESLRLTLRAGYVAEAPGESRELSVAIHAIGLKGMP